MVHCFIVSLNHRFIDSLNHRFIDPLIRWMNQWFVGYWLIHWVTASLRHWLIDSLIQWFLGSLIHWFMHLVVHGFFHAISLAPEPPFLDSRFVDASHNFSSTAHGFCISKTSLIISHWFLITISYFRYFRNFCSGASWALSGIDTHDLYIYIYMYICNHMHRWLLITDSMSQNIS